VIVDTDVLVWVLRGNEKAARAVDDADARGVSVVTYMELLQGARGKVEVRKIKAYLAELHFRLLPLTENIGHRASIYMEEYGPSTGMSMADALLAATVVENAETLLTANQKHYKPVKELRIKPFKP
jgi:hypothetical protein